MVTDLDALTRLLAGQPIRSLHRTDDPDSARPGDIVITLHDGSTLTLWAALEWSDDHGDDVIRPAVAYCPSGGPDPHGPRCGHCGSAAVQVAQWVDQRTGVALDDFGSPDSCDTTYCPDCDQHAGLARERACAGGCGARVVATAYCEHCTPRA